MNDIPPKGIPQLTGYIKNQLIELDKRSMQRDFQILKKVEQMLELLETVLQSFENVDNKEE